jgi:cytochrome c556
MKLFTAVLALLMTGALVAQVATTYESVASTGDIMHLMVIPASNALFDAGSKEKPTAEDWESYRKQAVILAEAGNLLMVPGHAKAASDVKMKASKSKAALGAATWNQASKLMRDSGKLALVAINKKDTDMLAGDVGEKILNSCSMCHDKYMVK